MISKEAVNEIIEDYIKNSDYYVVEIKISSDNTVLIEIDSFNGVSIDYCVELNRHIQSLLDREIEDYELQVGSAGLSEPFKVLKQYEKNLGNEVEVLTKAGKKHSGILKEVTTDYFILKTEKTEKPENSKRKITVSEDLTFSYQDIKTTKYIIRFK